MKPLTPKQEKFAQCVASGMTQADAYRDAYGQGNMIDAVIHNKASLMMQKGEVEVRVKELRELTNNTAILSITERKEWLSKLVLHKDTQEDRVFHGDKIRALDILNKMDGAYAPVKVEADIKATVNIYVPEQSEDE